MSWPVKPYVDELKVYEPGRPVEEVRRELGLKKLIKLASNENPLGTSAAVKKALNRALGRVHFYPESTGPLLLEALSRRLGVNTDQIILGNGSNEIIEFLCRAFLRELDEAVSSECTFLVYPLITQIAGGRYVAVPMQDGSRYHLEAMLKRIGPCTRLVFIANPNNPTGTYVSMEALDRFIRAVPAEVIVCVDEAYFDFTEAKDYPDGLRYIKMGYENVIVLRTFSKSYGLAGLRIGYGVADKKLIRYLHKVRQPFNVNALAQVAAEAALGDRAYLKRTRELVASGRRFFYKELDRLGLSYLPSQANFVLINLNRDAGPVVDRLLHKGLIVRGMKAYNLPSHIRVTVGLPSENARFIRKLERALEKTARPAKKR